jgi:hypothetical protein
MRGKRNASRNPPIPHNHHYTRLLAKRHTLKLLVQLLPVVGLQFRVFDPFLRPILVPTTHMVLRGLEVDELVSNAFLDENASSVLVDYRFLVLSRLLVVFRLPCISGFLTLIIDSVTFSISPGLTSPSGLVRKVASLFSLPLILLSR